MEKNKHILSRPHGLTGLGWFWVVAMVILAWHPYSAAADADPMEAEGSLERIFSNVKNSEQNLKTFSASFKQTQQNHLLLEPLVSQGSMFYDHTGKFLMRISHPEPYVMLLSDRWMIMGDPVAKTFRQRSVSGRNALLKRFLGMGQPLEGLKERYDIRFLNDCTGSDCRLELVSKNRGRKMPFQSIRLTFDTKLWLPTRIRLEEPNNDYTEFELAYVTINDPLPEDIFIMDMPSEETDDPFEPRR